MNVLGLVKNNNKLKEGRYQISVWCLYSMLC